MSASVAVAGLVPAVPEGVLASASALVVVASFLAAAVTFAATRSLSAALPVLLDLLLAAGLLRLSSDAGWRAILTAAAIVAVRRLVVAAVQRDQVAHRRGAGLPV